MRNQEWKQADIQKSHSRYNTSYMKQIYRICLEWHFSSEFDLSYEGSWVVMYRFSFFAVCILDQSDVTIAVLTLEHLCWFSNSWEYRSEANIVLSAEVLEHQLGDWVNHRVAFSVLLFPACLKQLHIEHCTTVALWLALGESTLFPCWYKP